MEKVDNEGNILGFSVLKVSGLKQAPLEMTLSHPEGNAPTP